MSLHSTFLPPAKSLTLTLIVIALYASREATPSKPLPPTISWLAYSSVSPSLYFWMLARS